MIFSPNGCNFFLICISVIIFLCHIRIRNSLWKAQLRSGVGRCHITRTPFLEEIVNVRASYADEVHAQPKGESPLFGRLRLLRLACYSSPLEVGRCT